MIGIFLGLEIEHLEVGLDVFDGFMMTNVWILRTVGEKNRFLDELEKIQQGRHFYLERFLLNSYCAPSLS